MEHASTGVIFARVAAIAGLTLVGATVLRVLARMFEPLTLVGLTLPVAAVASVIFMGVGAVQLVHGRKRTQTRGVPTTYGQRVLWLSITWAVLTLVAFVVVALLTYIMAVALNVPEDGTLLLSVIVAGPMLPLGVGATAAVEAVYEHKFASPRPVA